LLNFFEYFLFKSEENGHLSESLFIFSHIPVISGIFNKEPNFFILRPNFSIMSAVDSCIGSGTLREGREGAAVSFSPYFSTLQSRNLCDNR
jgi:hypothetical protein